MRTQADLHISWHLIDNQTSYQAALQDLAQTPGPIAIDTERASGYRYFQRAYLVQIKRGNGEIYLFDTAALSDLSELAKIINTQLWIVHSGRHDLMCLAELELYPNSLWDTELAARMLQVQRVGLGALVAQQLEIQLDKAYSDVDWSIRPLPAAWLDYAAVDVMFLQQLMTQQILAAELSGKLAMLRQEFAALQKWQPKPAPAQPWRKVSNITELNKDNRGLALVRELWYARDGLAQQLDIAPRALLPDNAMITAAKRRPRSIKELQRIKGFNTPQLEEFLPQLWRAVLRGKKCDENLRRTPPPTETSNTAVLLRDSTAKQRLQVLREALAQCAQALEMPAEHVLDATIVKRIAATVTTPLSAAELAVTLQQLGARDWQVEAVQQPLAAALRNHLGA